jgi:FAD binding domain
MRFITLSSLLLGSLFFSSALVSAELTRQPVASLEKHQRRALEIVHEQRAAASASAHFQPQAKGVSASPSSGLTSSGSNISGNPVAVAQLVLNPQSPIDLGQLLQDITPNYNYSAALDQACSAIHAQLPSNEYYGRVAIASDYVESTAGYYNERQAGNRPACVVYPTSGQDVSSIMKQLRKYSATYAVRSAGHSTGWNFTDSTGFSSTTGVLIDLSKLTAVSFDKSTGVARWETGLNWGELASQMEQYGAQVAGGRLGHVGPGLSLGGGISWYSGQVGFASDTSVAFEMVLADGRLVTATRNNQYSDLWWAQKTGINAFGIVVAIHSKTVPGE